MATYVSGTNFGDILTPDIEFIAPENLADGGTTNTASRIFGWGGDDILYGSLGLDRIWGGDGDDDIHAVGTGSNETMEFFYGEAGADRIYSGYKTMKATFDGGAGTDWLDFTYPPGTLIIDLGKETGSSTRNSNGLDPDYPMTGIENAQGSTFNDVITCDSGSNLINAGAGDDIVYASLGADQLNGGEGNDLPVFDSSTFDLVVINSAGATVTKDGVTSPFSYTSFESIVTESGFGTFVNTSASDSFSGSTTSDTAVNYSSDPASINAVSGNDGKWSVRDGYGSFDTLSDVNGIIGNAFDDKIIGGRLATDLLLDGGAGADTIEGGEDTGGGDIDYLSFVYRAVVVDLSQNAVLSDMGMAIRKSQQASRAFSAAPVTIALPAMTRPTIFVATAAPTASQVAAAATGSTGISAMAPMSSMAAQAMSGSTSSWCRTAPIK